MVVNRQSINVQATTKIYTKYIPRTFKILVLALALLQAPHIRSSPQEGTSHELAICIRQRSRIENGKSTNTMKLDLITTCTAPLYTVCSIIICRCLYTSYAPALFFPARRHLRSVDTGSEGGIVAPVILLPHQRSCRSGFLNV
jgi:hypothetical protein